MVRSPRPRHTKRRSLAVRRNARLLAKPGALELFHRHTETNLTLSNLIVTLISQQFDHCPSISIGGYFNPRTASCAR